MKAIEFPEANTQIAKDQPEYLTLPAYVGENDPNGYMTTCWKGTIKERILFLFTGKMYLTIMTFRKPLQPLIMNVDKWSLLVKSYFKSRRNLSKQEQQ